MKNEFAYKAALDAAWRAGEKSRIENGRDEWADEDIDAAVRELRRRLLNEE